MRTFFKNLIAGWLGYTFVAMGIAFITTMLYAISMCIWHILNQ